MHGAVRLIIVVLTPFVLDHVALIVEFSLSEGGKEEPHPIGFHIERKFKIICGDNLEVVRAIFGGGPVDVCPNLLQKLEMLAVGNVLGPFEHNMFEEMSEPCPSRLFILGTDMIHHHDGRVGNGTILMQDDVQSVRKRVLVDANSKLGIHGGHSQEKGCRNPGEDAVQRVWENKGLSADFLHAIFPFRTMHVQPCW